MLAKFEKRSYQGAERVWVGEYKHLGTIPHWHPENEILCNLSGSAAVMLAGKMYTIAAGECVFCSSGVIHSVDAAEDSTLLVCIFDKALTPFTAQQALKTPVFRDRYGIGDKLRAVRAELLDRPAYFENKCEAMTDEIIVDVFRSEALSPVSDTDTGIDRYQQLLNCIDSDYEFMDFESAARFMNFSEAYFSKFFKRQVGITFSRYLNAVKIEKAVQLLNTEPTLKIADVAGRCGFASLRSFNREFFKLVGFTPRAMPKGYSFNAGAVPAVQGASDPTLKTVVFRED